GLANGSFHGGPVKDSEDAGPSKVFGTKLAMYLVSHGVCSGDNSQRNSILEDRGREEGPTHNPTSGTPSLATMGVRLHNVRT
ncbi:hypothetical protein PoMZ_00580, partial [Pyricularia oryzae]